MSLFTIISDPAKGIAPRLGITAPASLFGSSDPNVPLLISIAQEEGEELSRRHDWQALTSIIGLALTANPQTLPSDFDRFAYNTEFWNSEQGLKYVGPITGADWQQLVLLGVSISPGAVFIENNAILITPTPTAGQHINFGYVSKNFVRSNTGTAKDAFSADTDTTVVPERLVGLGIIWRWKKSKGFAYAEAMATYERELERAASRDRGLRPITMSKPRPQGAGMGSVSWPGRITV